MFAPLVPSIAQQLLFGLVYALLVTLHLPTILQPTHAIVAPINF